MTLRGVYEGLLIELNKVQAPSILLEDFNYFVNKAVRQYVNKRYTIYDVNQQTSDDLRVLKATATVSVTEDKNKPGTYVGHLPEDYLHLLNCICNYTVTNPFKCHGEGDIVEYTATRLTADLCGQIINNAYMKPKYYRPYYYLNYVNTSGIVPTNIYNSTTNSGTDMNLNDYDSNLNPNLPRTFNLGGSVPASLVDIPTAQRLPNTSEVRIEIRIGKLNSNLNLENISVDYIKAPQYLRLTQEQIDLTQDTSQMMEFPDYVCQEIINELTFLIMENSSDPRLQTHIPVSTSIAYPAQASTSQ